MTDEPNDGFPVESEEYRRGFAAGLRAQKFIDLRRLEALEPFAALLQPHHSTMEDNKIIYGISGQLIRVGDLRRAKAALLLSRAGIGDQKGGES